MMTDFKFDSLSDCLKHVNRIFDSLGITTLRMHVSDYNDEHIYLEIMSGKLTWYWNSLAEFFGNSRENRSFFSVCEMMYHTYIKLKTNGDWEIMNDSWVRALTNLDLKFLRAAMGCSSFEELEIKLDLLEV